MLKFSFCGKQASKSLFHPTSLFKLESNQSPQVETSSPGCGSKKPHPVVVEMGCSFKARGTTYFYLDSPLSQLCTLAQAFSLTVTRSGFSNRPKFGDVTH